MNDVFKPTKGMWDNALPDSIRQVEKEDSEEESTEEATPEVDDESEED